MGRLSGKVALITGASSGIGAETARLFAAEGAKVAVAARRREPAEAVVKQIVSAGGEAIAVLGDIAEESNIKTIVAETLGAYGRIDVLHSNAALTDAKFMQADREILEMDAAVWQKTLAVNLVAPALLCKYALPHMIEHGGGSVIFTGSGRGVKGELGFSAYGASKAGLINLSQNVATQYGKQGIRSNIIVVGLVMTEALDAGLPKVMQDLVESHQLTPKLARPRSIANAALFLASDEADFVTGHCLYADGGITAHAPLFADERRMRAAGQGH